MFEKVSLALEIILRISILDNQPRQSSTSLISQWLNILDFPSEINPRDVSISVNKDFHYIKNYYRVFNYYRVE